jgi:adenylate cyclase
MTVYLRIALTALASLMLGSMIILFYFAYIDLETLRANKAFWRGNQLDWSVYLVTMLVLSSVAWVAMIAYARPLQQWERVRSAESVPTGIQQRAVIYPQALALISLAAASLAGLFFAQGGLMFFSNDGPTFWRTFIGVAVVGGCTIAMLIFLLSEQAWRQHLPRFVPPHGPPDPGRARLSVGLRLGTTLLLTGLVPLLVLGTIARNNALDIASSPGEAQLFVSQLQRSYLFIVGVAILSNLLLSTLAVRSLLFPLRQLTDAMQQVAEGDLSVRVPVMASDELGELTGSFNQMVVQLEQGQRMRDLFGRYVSREVADEVIAHGANLGGDLVEATILFADIRGFTSLSERLPAPQVVDILNRYFTHMVEVIVAEGGLVNKFGGDSLLAVFGAPIAQPDHALRGVRTAVRMIEALRTFNAEQRERMLPELVIGIGIASGEVVAGNIGGHARLEYTVIGDPVNLAARLQALTKEAGCALLVSAETQRRLGNGATLLEALGNVEVRGKAEAVQIYTLARPTP